MTERDELYRLSLSKWGKNLQRIMVIEECSELIQAIAKDIRKGVEDRKNASVCEEIADVEIMLEQARIMYDDRLISSIKEMKIKRLRERLDV